PPRKVRTSPTPPAWPTEVVTPELSACSRMPPSPRPASTATSAWPPSWAIVTTPRVSRHDAVQLTVSRASRPAASTAGRSRAVAGEDHYLLLVRTASPRALEGLLQEIRARANVATRTTVVLQTFFERRPPAAPPDLEATPAAVP